VQCRYGVGGVRHEPRDIFAAERFHTSARWLYELQPASVHFLERDAPAHRGVGELFDVVSTVNGQLIDTLDRRQRRIAIE
jgi:hypothetical protein